MLDFRFGLTQLFARAAQVICQLAGAQFICGCRAPFQKALCFALDYADEALSQRFVGRSYGFESAEKLGSQWTARL